ncbi:MAG: T9SS type A sorting domain-containing protein [Bacteroidia bacterium]
MKRFSVLILMLAVFSGDGLSQNYRPLSGAGAAWQLVTHSIPTQLTNYSYYYYLEVPSVNPDTSIQTNVYHKLIEHSINSPTGSYIGGFRSDSVGKTWWLPATDSTEYLLMDLNVQQGDTVYSVFSYNNMAQVVLLDYRVDSVGFVLIDGVSHKKIHVRSVPSGSNLSLWLEELGSFNGFFNKNITGLPYSFDNCLCISFDDTVRFIGDSIYLDPYNFLYWPDSFQTSAGTCPLYFMMVTGQTESEDIALRFYPNPASTSLTLEPPTNEPQQFSIYTVSGQLIHTSRIQGRSIIEVSHLPEGLYIIELETPQGILHQKLILQR